MDVLPLSITMRDFNDHSEGWDGDIWNSDGI